MVTAMISLGIRIVKIIRQFVWPLRLLVAVFELERLREIEKLSLGPYTDYSGRANTYHRDFRETVLSKYHDCNVSLHANPRTATVHAIPLTKVVSAWV